MIEMSEIFNDSDKRLALWCDSVDDTNDLAGMADYIIQSGMKMISVPPEIVYPVWTYLEGAGVKIMTRFAFAPEHKDFDACMHDLAQNITSICKNAGF